ncbi:MAG: HD domain-containing protein [Promethearchaeota archaeon]
MDDTKKKLNQKIENEPETSSTIKSDGSSADDGIQIALPSKDEAMQLMRRLKIPRNIINHQEAVMRKALDLAYNITKTDVNIELVRIGALVHDIGRYKTHGMDHGLEGGNLLRDKGYPEQLARIAETHSLAGLTAEEAVEFGLPSNDYLPHSLEEKIVCLADKYFSGTREVSIEKRFERWILKHGETPFLVIQLQRAKKLEEEILRLIF